MKAILLLGPGPTVRFFQSTSYVEKLNKQSMDRSHWVLVYLAALPEQRSKGISGALIQPILDRWMPVVFRAARNQQT